MNRLIALAAVLLLTGCGGVSGVVYGHSSSSASAAAEPGVSTYLCSGSTSDELLQWRESGGYLSGTYQYADITGQAPGEQVSSSSGNLSGTLSGTAITVSVGLSQDLYGTLSGGQLTLNVPQPGGTIQADTCNRATVSDWNSAVASLNNQASSDNNTASQAQASASTAASASAAQQSLASDVQTLSGDAASLDSNTALANDVSQMEKDWKTEQADWATESASSCPNTYPIDGGDTVGTEADAVGADYDGLQGDLSNLQNNGIPGIQGDLTNVQNDLSTLQGLGATPGTSSSAAIAAGNKAVSDTKSAISWASGQGSTINSDAAALTTTAENYADSHLCD